MNIKKQIEQNVVFISVKTHANKENEQNHLMSLFKEWLDLELGFFKKSFFFNFFLFLNIFSRY